MAEGQTLRKIELRTCFEIGDVMQMLSLVVQIELIDKTIPMAPMSMSVRVDAYSHSEPNHLLRRHIIKSFWVMVDLHLPDRLGAYVIEAAG